MKPTYYSIILFALLVTVMMLVNSCALDRTNPLDPKGNAEIIEPPQVLGLNLELIRHQGVPTEIVLRWEESRPPVDGYYIYRSFSEYSRYDLIHKETNREVTEFRDRDSIITGRQYWYRISAYIEYPEGELEGELSSPVAQGL